MFNFLTLEPESFGLEISESYLRIIKFKKNIKGFLKLSSWAEQELKPGIIEKGELKKEPEFLNSLLSLLQKVKGDPLKTKYIVVSLEEERAFLQAIKLPEMETKFLEKAVYFEAENYIPLKKEEACMDFEVISKTEVLIAAYPKKIVLPFLNSIKKAGLIVSALETQSQSITRALINKDQDYLIVDCQKEKIVILVYSKKTIRFTFTLRDKQEDEAIKEIKKCFIYCQNQKPIIILNKGFSLRDKLTSLGFLVKLADPWLNVFPEYVKEIPNINFEESLNYSTTIGLALRGIKKYD